MSGANRHAVMQALNVIEHRLAELGVSAEDRPPMDALASTLPFCYDTMELETWLQFVFVGRMRELLEQGDPLPETCAITPYVEMLNASGRSVDPELARQIKRIDQLITVGSGSGERI